MNAALIENVIIKFKSRKPFLFSMRIHKIENLHIIGSSFAPPEEFSSSSSKASQETKSPHKSKSKTNILLNFMRKIIAQKHGNLKQESPAQKNHTGEMCIFKETKYYSINLHSKKQILVAWERLVFFPKQRLNCIGNIAGFCHRRNN